jgi:protein-S-isoprenylcysteine O-methyltransferase Ste14
VRNPVRLKNLRLRFLPFFVLGAAALVYARPSLWSILPGVALVLAGEALRSWGAGHLVKNHELTVSGPYAHVRHPLYAGSLLVGTGFSLMVGGRAAVLLLALLLPWFFLDYFPRKERIESARLERRYGEAYAAYRRRVPALLPRLSPWRGTSASHAPTSSARARWSGDRFVGNNELGTALALAAGLGIFALRGAWPW